MLRSRARWNTALAWTSAPDLPRLESAAPASAPARAEPVSAGRHACKQDEYCGNESHDRRQTKRQADPVGDCGENDGYQDSDHCLPPPWWLKGLFPGQNLCNLA